jgi:hypothetical protein
MYYTVGYIIHEAFRLYGRAVVQQLRMAVIGWRDSGVNNAYAETLPKFLERYKKLSPGLRVRLLCKHLKTVIPSDKMIRVALCLPAKCSTSGN